MRLQTISQEILSRARLEELIARFGLYRDPRRQVPMELLVEKMRRDIALDLKAVDQTSGRGQTIAFALRYQGHNPQTVAEVANTLASFYVAANVKLRGEQAAGTAEFLRVQLAEMSKRVAEQEQRVRDYRTRYVGELPEQTAANLATLERLHVQVQLNSADQVRAMDRRTALLKQLGETRQSTPAKPVDAGEPADPTLGDLAKLRQQLTLLRQRFTDRYPEVARIKAEIAALERTLVTVKPSPEQPAAPAAVDTTREVIQDAVDDAENEIERFRAEERRLREQIAVYQRRIDNAPQREQEFRELARDFDTTKELHGSLLKRYEDARLAETMEQRQRGEQFRILDPALPARQPAAPNRLKLLIASIALSLGAAAAAVMLAEHFDTSFHRVEALRAIATAPVVVTIPMIMTAGGRRRHAVRFAAATAGVIVALAIVVKASGYLATADDTLVGLLTRGGA
jgi:polysaccharide chain length determinant protein (PEP-CTERM system associated)